MSLKRFAMLTAISYNNQQNYNNINSNNNTYYNKSLNSRSNESNTNLTQPATISVTTTTANPDTTTKIIKSKKSTMIQLKNQQQQQQSLQIVLPTILVNNTTSATTTATTTRSLSPSLAPLLTPHIPHSDKSTTFTTTSKIQRHDQQHRAVNGVDTNYMTDVDDSSQYSSESSEFLEHGHQTPPERQPSNTYTSTTYYGSGFGIFHQQNIRANGGGIALISGSSSSNGFGGGSYSSGINNNVNLLLGGAMLTLITTILCVVCYCCHRNIKKRTEAAYRQQRQWLENDPNMEIYSVEQCYETSGLFVGESMDGLATITALHHEPPPSYDAVVAMQEQQQLLMQQHQQQLIMQQQLLQQQLSLNNSPPPGYRSLLDVSSIIQGRGNPLGEILGVEESPINVMEINSLASSTANIRTTNSHSPIDPLLNYNDVNGNMTTAVSVATTTPTNSTTVSYLRNKQQHQQQRNLPANQMSQLNMKKVLQAQSCCSLQRAEVENMWNAAAAALAARSSHLNNDVRASTTASTSSPTLAVNPRKQSKSNTPETFGSRYLKQNYYRRGCPLCGKFRYDNDSTLSMSLESNLDTLAATLADDEKSIRNGLEKDDQTAQNNLNNNNNDNLANNLENIQHKYKEFKEADNNNENDEDGKGDEEDDVYDNDNDVQEQQCSCSNSNSTRNQFTKKENLQQYIKVTEVQQDFESNDSELETAEGGATNCSSIPLTADANANCVPAAARQSANQTNYNNNNNNDDFNLEDDSYNKPSTSAATSSTISTTQRTPVTAATCSPKATTSSVTINLDCINENGIISLDMSKIIDKTGLPTYDAALKLESSGYV